MTYVLAIFSIIIAVVVLFAFMTIWSRRETVHRALSIMLLLAAVPSLGVAAVETLGWHKPMFAAWRLSGEWLVIGHKMVADQGIYLYVDAGAGEPRAIVVPWSERSAQQLQDALRDSRRNGARGAILEYDWSLFGYDDPNFWPLPQPPVPMPKAPQEEPEFLERET